MHAHQRVPVHPAGSTVCCLISAVGFCRPDGDRETQRGMRCHVMFLYILPDFPGSGISTTAYPARLLELHRACPSTLLYKSTMSNN